MERHPLALGGTAHPRNPIKADGWPFASAVAQTIPGPGCGKRMHTIAWKPCWSQRASSRPRMCHLAGKYCFKREMMGCFCQVVDSGSSWQRSWGEC